MPETQIVSETVSGRLGDLHATGSADPRMALRLVDMPKFPTPAKRLPLRGEMRDHYPDRHVSRYQQGMRDGDT